MITYATRTAAMAAGASTYCSGVPCKHGHVAPRYTLTSVCSECQRLRAKETRERDKARFREAIEKRSNAMEG